MMPNDKNYDDLAKEANTGLNGLGKIVDAIAKLDKESSAQHRKTVVLTWVVIFITMLSLVVALVNIFYSPLDIQEKFDSKQNKETMKKN